MKLLDVESRRVEETNLLLELERKKLSQAEVKSKEGMESLRSTLLEESRKRLEELESNSERRMEEEQRRVNSEADNRVEAERVRGSEAVEAERVKMRKLVKALAEKERKSIQAEDRRRVEAEKKEAEAQKRRVEAEKKEAEAEKRREATARKEKKSADAKIEKRSTGGGAADRPKPRRKSETMVRNSASKSAAVMSAKATGATVRGRAGK